MLPRPTQSPDAKRLCLLLGLAVVLHRGRCDSQVPRFEIPVDGPRISLRFPEGWLDDHPLTRADLTQEQGHLGAAKLSLAFA